MQVLSLELWIDTTDLFKTSSFAPSQMASLTAAIATAVLSQRAEKTSCLYIFHQCYHSSYHHVSICHQCYHSSYHFHFNLSRTLFITIRQTYSRQQDINPTRCRKSSKKCWSLRRCVYFADPVDVLLRKPPPAASASFFQKVIHRRKNLVFAYFLVRSVSWLREIKVCRATQRWSLISWTGKQRNKSQQ